MSVVGPVRSFRKGEWMDAERLMETLARAARLGRLRFLQYVKEEGPIHARTQLRNSKARDGPGIGSRRSTGSHAKP